ncbi:hypothetical protein NDU88_002205 [Pleurodeles waltl]|uniref:Uncharacterized protein n=1 Tax=Pleurodeles waltl TaxID=8319 RepID=A0AAV7RD43_PLEWA|nr:hypothetical protein NDU88_002205 [Pleurodeles waltl]
MVSIKKARCWAGRAKEVFSGPYDGRGSAPTGIVALKGQPPSPLEWHRGQDASPQRELHAGVKWRAEERQEEAQGVYAPNEYGGVEEETTWLDYDEESVEKGEIRDKEEGDEEMGWWGTGRGVNLMT